MQAKINVIKKDYAALLAQLADLDAQLVQITAKEAAKRTELAERKAMLADRLRSAYDTDRTSLLESFLSGGTFTDLLAEMSYYIDVGEQDKALANQIAVDQETLAAIHQTTIDTRTRTDDLRLQTAAQKRALDRSLAQLNAAKVALRKLEKRVASELAKQKRDYLTLQRNKAAAKRAVAKASAAQKRLQAQINSLIRKQLPGRQHPVPVQRHAVLADARRPHPELRLYRGDLGAAQRATARTTTTGSTWSLRTGRRSRRPASGTVVYIGWNYADGADPAWIVIVAHSEGLQTWYAHMQPRYPGGLHAGSSVSRGQIIGYEGNTGHSTGAHLHWGVMFNGDFVNPRLFL